MRRIVLVGLLALIVQGTYAQMIKPQRSSRAEVKQRVGIADITIVYHRPAVKEREIWGTRLAPFGQVWRAGANENTTIEFTQDVLVEGKPLSAGIYGLHMLIDESNEWTVIFSNAYNSWGSFSYKEEEDALRVKVKTVENPHTEYLLYQFINLNATGATLVLDWEKVRIPIKMEMDNAHEVIISYYQDMLRGPAGFEWRGWFDLGVYCDLNNVHLEDGLVAADQSIRIYPKWDNHTLKENILRKLGRESEADQVYEYKLNSIATINNLNSYGYQLLGQNKMDEALKIFKLNAEKNPKDANVFDSLGECYKIMGDKNNAIKNLKKSLSLNPPQATKDNSIKLLKELGVGYAKEIDH